VMEYKVLLDSIEKVKDFVAAASNVPCDIDVISGRSYLDAKSVLGLLSVNLKEPLTIQILSDDKNVISDVYNRICSFMV